MCGGGGDGCGYLIANILYVAERLASCCAATAVVVCLVLTLVIMLGLGVGVGYNYCIIDTKLELPPPGMSDPDNSDNHEEESTSTIATTTTTTTIPPTTSKPKLRRKRDFVTSKLQHRKLSTIQYSKTVSQMELEDVEDLNIKPTMLIPLRNYDLLSLFEKLRQSKSNITLEIIQ